MDELQSTHKHKNFLVRLYFKIKFNTAIKLADLKKEDLILDFGCGTGFLKNLLRDYNVIGYDSTPEHTDVNDYTTLKPTKIFALDVFEHIPLENIKEIIGNFKKMSPSFKLITAIPTENKISILLRRLIGKPNRAEGHITRFKEIKEVLDNKLKLVKSKKLFTISYIGVYESS